MFKQIKTGDMIKFTPLGSHMVPPIAAPVPLIGTGQSTIMFLKICLVGDELPPFLKVPLPYVDGGFVIPGMGTLQVDLLPIHQSMMIKEFGKKALIQGTPGTAKFSVTVPAQQPAAPAPIPDPVPTKNYMWEFKPVHALAQSLN